MSDSSKRIVLTRREALLLSATAGIGIVASEASRASDSIKTPAHQAPGNFSTPVSAIAKTQYGKVRGFVDGDVFTFKGVPYGVVWEDGQMKKSDYRKFIIRTVEGKPEHTRLKLGTYQP